MFWVNVDIPNLECTIHKDNCVYPKRWTKNPGLHKPVGPPLGKNGGWLAYATLAQAKNYCATQRVNFYVVVFCQRCP